MDYMEVFDKLMVEKKFESFIRRLRFTNFKNIRANQEIRFDYPITALVGQNGTNKTSALVALYGSVNGRVPSEYWFSTPIDHTKEGVYQSYFYTYMTENDDIFAEVLMINNQRKDRDIDYWETARPQKRFGMNTDIRNIKSVFKSSEERWKKIEKEVLYINFRSEISAFDRCFYHVNNPSKRLSRQDYIRKNSKNLKRVIDDSLTSFKLYRKEKVHKPSKSLSQEEVMNICNILGKKYASIEYVEHSFFGVNGGTAILKTDNLNYSEAFAGSGEFAVVSLVHKLFNASEKSLILLDEPETSLHPLAQRKLLEFLHEQVKRKKHQIIYSTHSPEMIEMLPDKAIKLFSEDGNDTIIDNGVSKYEVFNKIGRDFNKNNIYVEDALAKEVLNYLFDMDKKLNSAFSVHYLSGGAEAIIKRLPTLFETGNHPLILLDGDKKPKDITIDLMKVDSLRDDELGSMIQSLTNQKINFLCNGGKNGIDKEQLYEKQREFLEKFIRYVRYFPFDTPERFILENHPILNESLNEHQDAKTIFLERTKKKVGRSDADAILVIQIMDLRGLENLNEFDEIKKILNEYLEGLKKNS